MATNMKTDPHFRYLMGAIVEIEGGYSNVKGDAGGETYIGITRASYPTPTIWDKINKYKAKNGGKIAHNTLFNDKELTDAVEKVYYDEYFKHPSMRLNEIENSGVSTHHFYVSLGGNKGKSLFANTFANGNLTTAINNANNDSLALPKFIQAIKQYYYDAVKRNPNNKKFLNGWLNRIDKINKYIGANPFPEDGKIIKAPTIETQQWSKLFYTPIEYKLMGATCLKQ